MGQLNLRGAAFHGGGGGGGGGADIFQGGDECPLAPLKRNHATVCFFSPS